MWFRLLSKTLWSMHYVWILCVLTICVGWQLVSSDPSLFHFMTFLLDWVILWGLAKWLNCLINIFHPSPNFWLSHPTCFYYLERDKKEHIWKLDLVQKEQVILEEEEKTAKESSYSIPNIQLEFFTCHSLFEPKCFLKSSTVSFVEEIHLILERKS